MKAVDLTIEQIDRNRLRAIASFKAAVRAYSARSPVHRITTKENAYGAEIKALVRFTGIAVLVWIVLLFYFL